MESGLMVVLGIAIAVAIIIVVAGGVLFWELNHSTYRGIGKIPHPPRKLTKKKECTNFLPDYNSTSITHCVHCGRERFEH